MPALQFMNLNVLVLPGDGIGTEVTREAVRVLRHVAAKWNHTLHIAEGLLGGIAIHRTGSAVSARKPTRLAADADATLMGAVGLPEFDNCPPEQRPEKGLLGIRKALGVFANLRPVRTYRGAAGFVAAEERAGGRHGHDHRARADRRHLLRHAARHFGQRPGNARRQHHDVYPRRRSSACRAWLSTWRANAARKVTSVDKSNVLENSQFWRQVVVEVAAEYPDVALDHLLVDNCAMQLVLNPRRFDVVLTENMFGDILSDEGAVLAGSIGMLPSASLGGGSRPARGRGCTSRCTDRRRISRGRTKPIRSARSVRWRPCSNTALDLRKKRPR